MKIRFENQSIGGSKFFQTITLAMVSESQEKTGKMKKIGIFENKSGNLIQTCA